MMIALSMTCKRLHRFFQPEFDKLDKKLLATEALPHAARSETANIALIVEMVKARPRLSLQKGTVTTRAGVVAEDVTLYQFFIREGDPWAAKKQIEPFFANLIDGENERQCQYAPYKAQIEELAKQFKEKKPTFGLKPLIISRQVLLQILP